MLCNELVIADIVRETGFFCAYMTRLMRWGSIENSAQLCLVVGSIADSVTNEPRYCIYCGFWAFVKQLSPNLSTGFGDN